MEHRWGQRVPMNLRVRLRCAPFPTQLGMIRDASVSGAFIKTPLPPPLYSRVYVKLVVDKALYTIMGYVTRHEHEGVGVEWAELAPKAICRQLRLSEIRATPPPVRSIVNPQSLAR